MSRYDIYISVILANMNGLCTLLADSAHTSDIWSNPGIFHYCLWVFLAQGPQIMLKMASSEKTVTSRKFFSSSNFVRTRQQKFI